MKLKTIRHWFVNKAPAFLALERAAVTIAALAAIVPLWQYWQEGDDRRLARVASMISALDTCNSDTLDWAANYTDELDASQEHVWNDVYFRAAAVAQLMCYEVQEALATDEIAGSFTEEFRLRLIVAQAFGKNPDLLPKLIEMGVINEQGEVVSKKGADE